MIEALLISVDEPQLERCLESIKNQTVPFSNLVHINNIQPYSSAYNEGISKLKDDWFTVINGDHILHLNAVEKITSKIKENNEPKIVGHLYCILDTFLNIEWGGIGTFKTDVVSKYRFHNRLDAERIVGRRLFKHGFIMKRHEGYLGTHFDSPDEFEVYRRFYIVGLKFKGVEVERFYQNVDSLYKSTGNNLYLIAMKAILFAGKKKEYPGSYNLDFDLKMYEKFKMELKND